MSLPRLLMDANAIIDCHLFDCWRAVYKSYPIETVEECFEECLRGANREQKHPIVREELATQLHCPPHPVNELMRATLASKIAGIPMDEGERDLMAYVITQDPNAIIICGPDNALLRAASRLLISERVVSLEEVVTRIGCDSKAKVFDLKNTIDGLRKMKSKVL